MEYNFREIEEKWQNEWRSRGTYAVSEDKNKQKFYVLDMFPYPSGAGLHVGHPLGYIASDIYARYMRHKGFNVLHPMGYDSFGLPAEQYAIQTGQHPAITTKNNIARYREQLDKIGFCYDWNREVRTSEPEYYKWTQWIFGLIFNSWFNKDTNKVEPLSSLIEKFEQNGTYNVNAACDEKWFKNVNISFFSPNWEGDFSATDWKSMNEEQQQMVLMQFRMAYLADSVVNWCPALGTVLANDEVKDGVSERGGHPVEQKLMRQWSMRISAYAERLLGSLEQLDWSESIKEVQRNWIGRSEGALVEFDVQGSSAKIPVFTTRPDTIFGVSFMTLAPEHALVLEITTPEYRGAIEDYIAAAKLKTERDRQSDVKNVSGQFTGAYAVHPFTGAPIPIWIGEYVLAGYGTGAVMAVPCGDQRDYDFAKKFDLPIPNILEGVDISEKAEPSKDAKLCNSEFLNGMSYKAATTRVIEEMEKLGIGKGRINYRMRDAVFSRQRYWGEPFPIFYKSELPYLMSENDAQVTLPDVDKYLPTEDGEPPLARAKREAWNVWKGDRMEYNTMPGWAGSSWYFLRYMDPKNPSAFASREKVDYWGQVDLYMGGAEHGTGHLLYSRFWTKVLFDLGYIGFDEPFKKMINQGMITGRSSFGYRLTFKVLSKDESERAFVLPDVFVSKEIADEMVNSTVSNEFESMSKFIIERSSNGQDAVQPFNLIQKGLIDKGFKVQINLQRIYMYIGFVDNDILNIDLMKSSTNDVALLNGVFLKGSTGAFVCGWEIEKMSKNKLNVQTPDELVEKFGADTLRCYEMFLGPVEQSKPWDTKGINGVHNFLRKFWRLYHDADNNLVLSDDAPTKSELKTLHKTIKKINEDLDRFSWNTCVSAFMICVNELQEQKCNKRQILEPLCVLLSPYAPHIVEELWAQMGHSESITGAAWPVLDMAHLTEDEFEYPVSFNGKTRYFISLPADMPQADVEATVRANENTAKYLEGKEIKKMIVVPKRIVNVVV